MPHPWSSVYDPDPPRCPDTYTRDSEREPGQVVSRYRGPAQYHAPRPGDDEPVEKHERWLEEQNRRESDPLTILRTAGLL